MKTLQTINYTYLIEEMIEDAIDNTKANSLIKDEEERLLQFIIENNKEKEFKRVTTQSKEIISKIEENIKRNDNIITKCKFLASFELSKREQFICSILLEAFGIANREGSTLEERLNNQEELIEIEVDE